MLGDIFRFCGIYQHKVGKSGGKNIYIYEQYEYGKCEMCSGPLNQQHFSAKILWVIHESQVAIASTALSLLRIRVIGELLIESTSLFSLYVLLSTIT